MNDKLKEANEAFATEVEAAYAELLKIYNNALGNDPDRNETFRRSEGEAACRRILQSKYILPNSTETQANPVLSCIGPIYSAFVERRYSKGEIRFAEWFRDDWKKYLLETHRIGNPAVKRKDLDKEAVKASRLARYRVATVLAYEAAYERLLAEHTSWLNQNSKYTPLPIASAEDSEPASYEAENEKVRVRGSFSRSQCTAAVIVLIDALTRHNRALALDSESSAAHVNIYNLSFPKLATLISKLTGFSADNIRKDLYEWRSETAADDDKGKLRKVRDALLSFEVEIDTTILDNAIARSKKNT